ncbi:YjeF N-terminal domain-containing protein [Lipomyces japonicus]|uniref:YjeF N-terminal domain-containing protein n=1 Tax=Lipomyces japonicus TaxID=56871 RepID=UPI0034CFA9DD
MAALAFIGVKVLLKLQNGFEFQGVVSEISGSKLRLINVFDQATGDYVPSRVIDGSKIADLTIIGPSSSAPSTNGTSTAQRAHRDPLGNASYDSSGRENSYRSNNYDDEEDDDNDEQNDEEQEEAQTPVQRRKNKKPKNHMREPSASYVPQPFANQKKGKWKQKNVQDQSFDWASEDLSGIKNIEFDFQGNLDRFDKKTVFDEIRLADTTDPEQRLVSHNKKDANGKKEPTKKNYLPTENVLGSKNSQWQGLSIEDDNELFDDSMVKAPAAGEDSEIDKEIKHQQFGRISRAVSKSSISRNTTPPIIAAPRRLIYDLSYLGTSFPIFPCPAYSTAQIASIERACATQYGLHAIQLSENAGVAIARFVVSVLGGKRRFERRQVHVNALPVVVVLAGNHESGARAIAGARMLVNRKVRVVVLLAGEPAEIAAPCDSVRTQILSFKAAGGKITSRLEVLRTTLRVLDSPPELIIDALQGVQENDGSHWASGVPSWLYETVAWTTTQRAHILAIDAPAGMDPDTGHVLVKNIGRAKWIMCLGVPVKGVPFFMQYSKDIAHTDLDVSVIDIGIPGRCYKKVFGDATTVDAWSGDIKDGIDFSSEWHVRVILE